MFDPLERQFAITFNSLYSRSLARSALAVGFLSTGGTFFLRRTKVQTLMRFLLIKRKLSFVIK